MVKDFIDLVDAPSDPAKLHQHVQEEAKLVEAYHHQVEVFRHRQAEKIPAPLAPTIMNTSPALEVS